MSEWHEWYADVSNDLVELGQRIVAKRKAQHITGRALAELLDLHHVTLHHVEHGRMIIPLDAFERVMNWLEA